MHKISLIINTLNEEKNIFDCLSTVSWADEIILVDMHSDDNTISIAKQFPNVKVFYHERCGYADPARAFALAQVSNEWVLMLDADERVGLATKLKIEETIESDIADVIYVRRYNYFWGEEIKYGFLGNEYMPRVFKKWTMNYTGVVHQFENVAEKARKTHLESNDIGIVHFSHGTIESTMEKHDRYSTIEARNMFDGLKKPWTLRKIIFNYPYKLLGNLIYYKGYKQFRQQFSILTFMFFYNLTIYLKYYNMKKFGTKDYGQKLEDVYAGISRDIIKEYQK